MIVTVNIRKQIPMDVRAIRVSAPIRYPEDFEALTGAPVLVPGNSKPGTEGGPRLEFTADVLLDNTLRIREHGTAWGIFTKVCDEGTYTLLGPDDVVIATIHENYVPILLPGEYGDYLGIGADEHGTLMEVNSYGEVQDAWHLEEHAVLDFLDRAL